MADEGEFSGGPAAKRQTEGYAWYPPWPDRASEAEFVRVLSAGEQAIVERNDLDYSSGRRHD